MARQFHTHRLSRYRACLRVCKISILTSSTFSRVLAASCPIYTHMCNLSIPGNKSLLILKTLEPSFLLTQMLILSINRSRRSYAFSGGSYGHRDLGRVSILIFSKVMNRRLSAFRHFQTLARHPWRICAFRSSLNLTSLRIMHYHRQRWDGVKFVPFTPI